MERKMNTKSTPKSSLKVILAAVGIAVLASPVKAETWRDLSTDNALWSEEVEPEHAHVAASHPRTGRLAPGVAIGGASPRILDCVHVAFPQCSGGS
jgi:hypothetical protein